MNSLNDILEAKSKANAFIAEKKYSAAETAYKKLLDDIEFKGADTRVVLFLS